MKALNRMYARYCPILALAAVLAANFLLHAAPRPADQGRAQVKSDASRLVTGPSGPLNEAIAAGATVEVTLQPVEPKTQPPSTYSAGSSIVDQTLTLGTVPARVWVEVLVTGWGPEMLDTVQVTISATNADMDGGGYSGAASDCEGGGPSFGAGDLTPAMQPCGPRYCENRPELACATNQQCRLCDGGANADLPCTDSSSCPGGTCPSISASTCDINIVCRNEISGRTSNCSLGEPAPCVTWSGLSPNAYFPAGMFCEPGFLDVCDLEYIGSGAGSIQAVDRSTKDFRFGVTLFSDPSVSLLDFSPSYLGTFVIDAPANARGTYTIDVEEGDTFLLDHHTPLGNDIPIALFRPASIVTACTLQANPSGLSNTRFISFSVPPNVAGTSALRVTPISLHHVNPPYTGGASIPFTAFESGPDCGETGHCVRWVGPPTLYMESTSDATPFYASSLQCTPHYQDWRTVGLLHVTGSAIVPSSVYEVEAVDETCTGNEANCIAVTPAISLGTTRWGDVAEAYNPPSITAQPDVADIAALVAKFRSLPGAPIKARAFLAGDDAFGNFNSLAVDVGFTHIAGCVDAFRGKPYPHTISSCP